VKLASQPATGDRRIAISVSIGRQIRPPLRHSITPFPHPPVPFGSHNRLSPKLFSLLQIRFFGSKTAFTQSLQGFF
jgi:hypothetical protein